MLLVHYNILLVLHDFFYGQNMIRFHPYYPSMSSSRISGIFPHLKHHDEILPGKGRRCNALGHVPLTFCAGPLDDRGFNGKMVI